MKFLRELEDGFVLVLSLLVLPVFLGFGVLLIDIGRGNNAQSDLQAVVDAMALTGARELDGTTGARQRAHDAMEELTNTVSMLEFRGGETTIPVTYAQGDARFDVHFLDNIPDEDTTSIDAAYIAANTATTDEAARYVYVRASSPAEFSMDLIFDAVLGLPDTIGIGAVAVATNPGPVACNVTPIFICNPYESSGKNFDQEFAAGDLYGRLFEMYFTANNPPGPGNFGFLRVGGGNGADVLRDALATGDSQACYVLSGVDTEPGVMSGPVETGINVHFGLYDGSMSGNKNDPLYRPAPNVRMGQTQGGQSCKSYNEDDPTDAMALPRGVSRTALPGGYVSVGSTWDIDEYWSVNFETSPAPVADIRNYFLLEAEGDGVRSSHPSGTPPAGTTPSRYDVYLYELSSETLMEYEAPNGEIGIPQCWGGGFDDYTELQQFRDDYAGLPDRRTIFAAVINCLEYADEIQGAAVGIPVESFVKMFLTKPAVTDGNTRYLSLEIIDKTGSGGAGTMDEFVRYESFLVR